MRYNHAKSTGPLLWALCIQYFIVQVIVIWAWTVPHSLKNNFISDLGNTECGIYAGLAVCSPLHLIMNISFIVFGISMVIGALLIARQLERTKLTTIGFALMVAAGVGTILVGVFPENTVSAMHQLGAVLSLGVGNLSVLLIGLGLKGVSPLIKTYTILSAIVSLSAFTLFVLGIHFELGRGGMERLISYPFSVWMIAFGTYLLLRKQQ